MKIIPIVLMICLLASCGADGDPESPVEAQVKRGASMLT